MRRVRCLRSLAACVLLVAVSCNESQKAQPAATPRKAVAKPAQPADENPTPAAAWSWDVPQGLGTPPIIPEDNPMTAEKVELGHRLFMDKRLSVDGTRSCYSCHQNELGNADGRATALGPGNKPLPRNTPTIWNVGYLPALYWDGRAATLEQQAIGALKGGNMALGEQLEAKAAEIGALPEYREVFARVFDLKEGDPVTPDHVAKALSAYERTLLCGATAYDKQELSESAKRGWSLFTGKAGCITCHNGPNFTDGIFHATGAGLDPKNRDADLGRGGVAGHEADKWKFRTPTLRNVSKTAPYFHNGSVDNLEEAVRIMASGGVRGVVQVDELLADRKLSDAEIEDLVAFLESLECPGQLEVIGDQSVPGIPETKQG